MSAKRIAAQVAISRQLLVESVGTAPLDEYIASRIRLVFSSRLDQACLYGAGAASNEPLGVINASGTNLAPLSPFLLLKFRGIWSAAQWRWSRPSRRRDRKLDAK
jgi:HK97 family phage major capsid protein